MNDALTAWVEHRLVDHPRLPELIEARRALQNDAAGRDLDDTGRRLAAWERVMAAG